MQLCTWGLRSVHSHGQLYCLYIHRCSVAETAIAVLLASDPEKRFGRCRRAMLYSAAYDLYRLYISCLRAMLEMH